MKLAQLWSQHQQYLEKDSLSKNFGDSYLYSQNRIFRNIRKAVLQKKFRFSCEQHPLYLALPLSQLEWIISEKTIPYIDNASVLKQIHEKLPTHLVWDDISDNLKGNHVFHESCHGIARSVTLELASEFNIQAQKDFQKMALIKLLEESFANTCELLAVADVKETTHRIFFELNSYVCMFEDRTHLKSAMTDLGEVPFMKFMLLCYLHANFLTPSLNEQRFEKLIDLSFKGKSLTAQQQKTLRALSRIAFELNIRFRQVTTSFYLRLNNISKPMQEVLSFDFIQMFETSAELTKAIDTLIEIALLKA